MAIDFKGAHFPPEVILMGVRWYVAYPLSTRHVEELMEERGVEVDHSTINRWVIKYSPQLEEAFHRRKRPVWVSWRMDETYIKVKGQWRYLYRAVDKQGHTIDFLLTEHRDKAAALRFLKRAIRRNGLPKTITIDGSDANEAAIKSYNEEHGTAIIIRQVKYLGDFRKRSCYVRVGMFRWSTRNVNSGAIREVLLCACQTLHGQAVHRSVRRKPPIYA